jgi:stage III sporulation protein AE
MINIKKALLAMTAAVLILNAKTVYAEDNMMETGDIDRQLEAFDFMEIQRAIDENESDVSFGEIVKDALSGRLQLSPQDVFNAFLSIFFEEARNNAVLMRNLLLVCVLSAIINNLTNSFASKTVGELGFYVCFIVIMGIIMSAFGEGLKVAENLIGSLAVITRAGAPLFITLTVMSGSIGAHAHASVLYAMTSAVTTFAHSALTPLLTMGAALTCVNYITRRELLTNLSKLIKQVCEWSIKAVLFVFITIMSLQKFASPFLNSVAVKSAKAVAKATPVIGDAISGAMDYVLVWSQGVKNGVLVATVITIAVICAAPLIKIFVMFLALKITAAAAQPICDERVVKCANDMGEFSLMLLSVCAVVIVMFIMALIVLLSF